MTWEGAEENYNVFRWYRAGWGRYSQADLLGARDQIYSYASDDPVIGTDPFGLMTFTPIYPFGPRTSPDPSSDCHGAATKVACTELNSVSLHCSCHCDFDSWVPDVVMIVNVRMVISNNVRPHMAQDPSIVDFATAVAHEHKKHLDYGEAAVEKWLRGWMRDSYPNKAACEKDCSVASSLTATATSLFREALKKSQLTND